MCVKHTRGVFEQIYHLSGHDKQAILSVRHSSTRTDVTDSLTHSLNEGKVLLAEADKTLYINFIFKDKYEHSFEFSIFKFLRSPVHNQELKDSMSSVYFC